VSTLGQGTGGRWISVDKFPTSVDAAVRFLLNVFSESEQLKIAAMTTSTRCISGWTFGLETDRFDAVFSPQYASQNSGFFGLILVKSALEKQ